MARKIILILFVICFVACNFFEGLIGCDADRILPEGATEIEINNWTKTREPVDIGQAEKKMNSYIELGELNNGISDVDKIEGLYNSNMELVDINTVNNLRQANGEEAVIGDKVLRTIVKASDKKLKYNFPNVCQYLKSDSPVNWQNNAVNWSTYTSQDDNAMEWRMISGKFNITTEQSNMLISKNYQLVLGMPVDNQNGFELIVPFNDIMSVFINGKATNLNYRNSNLVSEYFLNGNTVGFEKLNAQDCQRHVSLCSHTGNIHIDMEKLNEGKLKNNLSNNVNLGENSIDFLVGNFSSSQSGGFSKLNLYIVESPDIKLNLNFYTYDGEQKVYFDSEYLPTINEEVYFEVDMENSSDSIDLENIYLDMKIGEAIPLKFGINGIYYNNQAVNIENCTYTLHHLEKITLSSEQFKYAVTKEDCLRKYICSSARLGGNYITQNLPYLKIYEKITTLDSRLRNPVEGNIASLSVNCEVEGAEYGKKLVMKLTSSNDFCNILLENGHTSNVKNLGLRKYTVSIIIPQGYEVVECPDSFSFSNTNLTRTATVKLRKKDINCFYRDDRVMICFE